MADEHQPILVKGPLEPVVMSPNEKIGERPLGRLRLIPPQQRADDIPIFQFDGFEVRKLGIQAASFRTILLLRALYKLTKVSYFETVSI
jgi:hypothetical protein